jgi:hypothetical protein
MKGSKWTRSQDPRLDYWRPGFPDLGHFAEAELLIPRLLRRIMPYCIQAKIEEGAFSVVVETAKDALAKFAELTEVGHSEVTARDIMSGAIVGLASLQAEADDAP